VADLLRPLFATFTDLPGIGRLDLGSTRARSARRTGDSVPVDIAAGTAPDEVLKRSYAMARQLFGSDTWFRFDRQHSQTATCEFETVWHQDRVHKRSRSRKTGQRLDSDGRGYRRPRAACATYPAAIRTAYSPRAVPERRARCARSGSMRPAPYRPHCARRCGAASLRNCALAFRIQPPAAARVDPAIHSDPAPPYRLPLGTSSAEQRPIVRLRRAQPKPNTDTHTGPGELIVDSTRGGTPTVSGARQRLVAQRATRILLIGNFGNGQYRGRIALARTLQDLPDGQRYPRTFRNPRLVEWCTRCRPGR